jgi:sugar phosphate isomerase/epimerase
MDPKHWAEVRSWSKEAGMPILTGGPRLLPAKDDTEEKVIAVLRKHIERAHAMGSPIVRTLLASDRYAMPDGPVEKNIETALRVLKTVRSQAMDAGVKVAIENHKDVQAWRTRQVIDTAGRDFVASYLDTGNPVFVAEDPATTLEHLGPVAVCFHLRDSVVYEHPDGIAIQWVPLGQGTVDFQALVARAAEVLPAGVPIYCKPITARPPVVLPVYGREFFTKWFPNARAEEFAKFLALAKRGKPWNQPHLMADLDGVRDRYLDGLRVQQMEHMETSLKYCFDVLKLGIRRASA